MIDARLSDINMEEAAAYLGVGGSPDEGLKERLSFCIDSIMTQAQPRLVYKRVPVTDGQIEGINLAGNDIQRITGEASEAVVLAATLGHSVDMLVNRLQVNDMATAVIMDACASAAIENVCNNFEADMRLQVEREGFYLTERYSPGYGDLPLSLQRELGEFLNCQRRIGLIVADNYMMTPIKSVTAIMGITKKAVSCRIHRCESCTSRETCTLRAARGSMK